MAVICMSRSSVGRSSSGESQPFPCALAGGLGRPTVGEISEAAGIQNTDLSPTSLYEAGLIELLHSAIDMDRGQPEHIPNVCLGQRTLEGSVSDEAGRIEALV